MTTKIDEKQQDEYECCQPDFDYEKNQYVHAEGCRGPKDD